MSGFEVRMQDASGAKHVCCAGRHDHWASGFAARVYSFRGEPCVSEAEITFVFVGVGLDSMLEYVEREDFGEL